MNIEEPKITEEDLLKKHRDERKELQCRIQSLKKTAPKGKKKKEIQETITQMEKELDAKHQRELDAINPSNEDSLEDTTEETSEILDLSQERISRAQRRRNKKTNEERERDKRIKDQEEENKQGPRVLEIKAIKDILKSEGLQLHNIPADGNCLYCAVKHQLETTGRESTTVSKLREITARYIRDNKDDFLPFMCNDSDEPVNEEQFEKYCKDVASSKFWGGQVELKALSSALRCPIKVIQASGPSTLQGEDFKGPPLTVTYHRHLYRLGEHYNSTVVCAEQSDLMT